MNWKRFFALLLVLALLPALFGNAFAAGPKARTLTDADYAPIDALWAELDAVEQDAQTQSAQNGPDRTLAAAQAVAQADMLLIGGTQLSVYPAAGLLRYFYSGDWDCCSPAAKPRTNQCI